MILSFFGWIILLLSGFLVINTISALIAQQINQIGIMKLIGASRGQMVAMYVTLVLVYGVIAFSMAIPAGRADRPLPDDGPGRRRWSTCARTPDDLPFASMPSWSRSAS